MFNKEFSFEDLCNVLMPMYACSSYACSIRVGWGGPFVTENIFTALMQL